MFLADSYDISDLAGQPNGALRFSYATDPGLARPGWFIDDVKVTATTPAGEQVLLETDFESDGGPDDDRVSSTAAAARTSPPPSSAPRAGSSSRPGAESAQDHGYYLEMRDRSGFDLDGHGQIDRDPIGWEAGLYLAYTDEAHGYGNAGTDDPPAQSPLDATPEPGTATPNLNDAAFTDGGRAGRRSPTPAAGPHVDNYTDPSTRVAANLGVPATAASGFDVLSMGGAADGPADVRRRPDRQREVQPSATAAATFDYGYDVRPARRHRPNTAPDRRRPRPRPTTAATGETVAFSGADSDDAETPDDLDYTWDFDNGGADQGRLR